MPKKQPHRRPKNRGPKGSPGRSPSVTARKLASGDGWVLVHPRCAVDRAEDLEEVHLMIEGGEFEIAVEELRWLLSGCTDLMAGHVLLGDLALEMGSPEDQPSIKLARGHYGYAYQLGEKAIRHAKTTGPLPASQPANRAMHEAARGLAWCLEKLEKPQMADEIVALVKKLDPADPLGVAAVIDELRSGGLPVVGLGDFGG